jgi:hypothetical protein
MVRRRLLYFVVMIPIIPYGERLADCRSRGSPCPCVLAGSPEDSGRIPRKVLEEANHETFIIKAFT